MASGGTVLATRMDESLETPRDSDKFHGLGIKGQSLHTKSSDKDGASRALTPDLASLPAASRPSSTGATSIGQESETLGSFKMPPEAVSVLETVINMNKTLEQQIDALRIRLNVESKQHDTERRKIIGEKDKELNKKESEVQDLRDSLLKREDRIKVLVGKCDEKDRYIEERVQEINGLKALVKQTEDYANELQKKAEKLRVQKQKLESDGVYKEQNEEIRKLRHELVEMKDKLASMEKELARARNIMEQQNTKIRTMEVEKNDMHTKFREDLDKASRAMRMEVERMREVMKQQYEEMRNLREQNLEICGDVREIKDMLMNKNQATPSPRDIDIPTARERIDVNKFKTPRPLTNSPNLGFRAPPTARNLKVPVRASVPSVSPLKTTVIQPTYRSQNGLPPIVAKDEKKWVPSGIGARQSTTLKSARARKN
ncbi:hypothetical protein CHS0354_010614 [Potamilus streckersoni]|uniref:Uncharacterized protein n=1 Tax=Potamilus streckersoni TaxID=2493646 RepID=A0AAE0SGX1_9BIVA|nr:hypothetical protein CHS0354_010614 [Potamilus streckersoni]